MIAAGHVDRIRNGEYVGSTLKWSEPAIAKVVVAAEQLGRSETATHAICCGLGKRRGQAGVAIASRAQVRALNAKFRGLAGTIAEGEDVIEDSIESKLELIDGPVGENVGFRNRRVASVIGDVLRAGKRVLFGKTGSAARNERRCLIVTEAREYRVFAREL